MKKLTFAAMIGCKAILLLSSARAADTILDVPEGAVVTNTTALLAEKAGVDKLVKRGKGTYYANCPIGRDASSWSRFAELLVEEGEIILCCGEHAGFGNCYVEAITVKSGARVRCEKQSGQSSAFSQFYRVCPSLITVEEGALFDANGAGISSYLITPSFAGAGTLRNTAGTHYGELFTGFTGVFVNDTTAQHNPSFDAAFDFTRTGGFIVSNNVVRANDLVVQATFENLGSDHWAQPPFRTDFAVPTNTAGRSSFAAFTLNLDGPLTIDDFTMDHARLLLNKAATKLTINGGRAALMNAVNCNDIELVAGSSATINGGRFVRCGFDGDRNRYYTTELKDGTTRIGDITVSHVNFLYNTFSFPCVDAEFVLNGGHVSCRSYPYHTYLRGGKINWTSPGGKGNASSNVWDGVKCYCWTSGSSAFSYSLDSAKNPFVFCVGKKGGWFETLGRGGTSLKVETGWKSACPDGETDGGMKFFGYGYLTYAVLPEFRGPFEANLASLRIPSATDYDTDHLFGYGNLVLGNTILPAGGLGSTVRLAGGPGAKLVAKGAAQIEFSIAGGVAAKVSSYVAGPSGASVSSLAREKGGALILFGNSASFAIGTESSLKVEGGVEKNAAGLPKVPVIQANTLSYAYSGRDLGFADYDAETGFVPFANYQSAFDNRATDVVWLYNVQTNLTADTAVGALLLENRDSFVSKVLTDTRANIYLSEGVTLSVGDGTNPAAVLFNSTSADVQACVKGDGTMAFGNSEALFAVNGMGALMSCNITGNNDFSFVGTGDYPSMRLSRDQSWTGTVRANNCRLVPETSGALGSGKIVLGSGWGLGGTLELSTADLVFANDITMGGSGVKSSSSNVSGALVALTNATLTGDIDFYGTAWIGVGNQGCLTLTGEMKGDDNLEIVNPNNNKFAITKLADKVYSVSETALARDTNGRVIIEGKNNAYTGDVSVIRTTLVLRGAKAGLGWGDVELDAATLRFENTTPLTIHGRITGSGVLELAGRGLVTFADLYGQSPTPMPVVTPASGYTVTVATAKDESKFTLKLARSRTAVNSLKGVGEITTDLTRPVHLSVLDDAPGSYTGTLPANVTLHYGEIYRTGCAILLR